jgi:hypothetical protein
MRGLGSEKFVTAPGRRGDGEATRIEFTVHVGPRPQTQAPKPNVGLGFFEAEALRTPCCSLLCAALFHEFHIDRDCDILGNHGSGNGTDSEIAAINCSRRGGAHMRIAPRILHGFGRAIDVQHDFLCDSMDCEVMPSEPS